MRISDWSSDVCSSDLRCNGEFTARQLDVIATGPCWPCTLVKSVPELRYFLDTEFNGFGGDLISLALVPEYGDQDFYVSLPLPAQIHPWVEQNVIPYLRFVPAGVDLQLSREQAARHRSEERRVGKECVSTCRARGW